VKTLKWEEGVDKNSNKMIIKYIGYNVVHKILLVQDRGKLRIAVYLGFPVLRPAGEGVKSGIFPSLRPFSLDRN
jgi:hypothetical protein